MTAQPGPVRCIRCGGSGDIPIITEDATLWENRDRAPLLKSCPNCAGTGMLRESEDEPHKVKR